MHILFIASQLIWIFGILAGSLGVGRYVFNKLRLLPVEPATELVLGLGLGLGILSYLTFIFASLHVLSPGLLWVESILWICLGPLNLRLPKLALSAEKTLWVQSPGRWIILFLAGSASLTLLTALVPAWDWDGVAYHLALPKLYLAAHGFVFRPDIYHNLFPQFTEMLYLLGMVFPDGIAAKLFHFSFGLMAATTVYAWLRESRFRLTALLGMVLFYWQYLVHIESGTAFIDLATTAYAALAMLCFFLAVKVQKDGWYPLAALFGGMAAATKWHGLILLVLLGGLMFIRLWFWENRDRAAKLRITLWILCLGSLPVIPYLARAWLLGGNPIWPLGYSIFGGHYWDPAIAKAMTDFVAHFAGVSRGWKGFMQLPYDLMVHGKAFGVGGQALRFPLLGLFLLLLGYAVWLRKESAVSKKTVWQGCMVAAVVLFLVIWYASSPQTRYLLPLFPLLAYGCARTLHSLWFSNSRLAKGAAIFALLLLVNVHPPVHHDTWEHIQVITGRQTTAQFFKHKLNHYAACMYLNRQVQPPERVLLFKENRGFYLDVPYLWGDPLNQDYINYRTMKSTEDLHQRLQELKVAWVYYRRDVNPVDDYYPKKIISLMDRYLETHGTVCFEDNAGKVYRLSSPN